MNCDDLTLYLLLLYAASSFMWLSTFLYYGMKYHFFLGIEEAMGKIKKEEEEKRKLNLRKILKGEAHLELSSKYPELLRSFKVHTISVHLFLISGIVLWIDFYLCVTTTAIYLLAFYLALYPILIVRTIKLFKLKKERSKSDPMDSSRMKIQTENEART